MLHNNSAATTAKPGPPPRADKEGRTLPAGAMPQPSRRSRRALDWFVFFVADVQTGFGPFVAVYLTAAKWTQTDIGLVLTVGGLVSLFAQIPAGALVDRVRSQRMAALVAMVVIGLSALALAIWPLFAVVLATRVAQAGASCVLGVCLASLSLRLVGRARLGARLGRNAAFMSAGTGLAAAGMGACGYYWSNQAVFFVAALLVLPGLVALGRIAPGEVAAPMPAAQDGKPDEDRDMEPTGSVLQGLAGLARSRALVIFAGCVVLFQMANASLLPLAASMVTLHSNHTGSAMVAAAIVVPQAIVTVLSPFVGSKAQAWGRKPLLLVAFLALPIRAALFALTVDPRLLVAVQVLDGVSAAGLGVLVPLIIADVAGRTGRYNLAQGAVGCAVGIGASVSTTAVGYLADHLGSRVAFNTMAVVAMLGFLVVLALMPETRPAAAPTTPEKVEK